MRTCQKILTLFNLLLFMFHPLLLTTLWAEDVHSPSNSLAEELHRLEIFEPELFKNREAIHELLPNEHYADILFLAARYCKNDIQVLQKQFPTIYTVFSPSIIEDLDNDGTEEIVINLSGYLSGDVTWLQVIKKHQKTFDIFEYRVDGPMMDVLPGTYERKKKIILTRTGIRKVQIKGKNELIPLEFIEEMVLVFTGRSIEVVSPRNIVHEQIVINNLP